MEQWPSTDGSGEQLTSRAGNAGTGSGGIAHKEFSSKNKNKLNLILFVLTSPYSSILK